jgi:putative transposase
MQGAPCAPGLWQIRHNAAMSRYRRSHTPGASYFFTVATLHRRPLLAQEPVRIALRQAIAEARRHAPFRIHAWVLLPEHLHCIWELPTDDADFGTRWSLIKRKVTQACGYGMPASASGAARREGGLWQRRFWEHQIRDERDFERHVDYVHFNPVKHGHVRSAKDWPFSTFHRYVKEGLYPEDWGGTAPEETSDLEFGE